MWFNTLFPKILDMSLTAGIVIVLVLLARLLMRKAPKVFSYALWAAVLFRLFCPLTFESPVSIVPDTPSVTAGQLDAVIPAVTFYTPANIISNRTAETENPDNPVYVASEADGNIVSTFVWLLGIAAMLIYSLFSLLRLKRKLVGAVRLRENIYLADRIAAPFVIGVIRPKIYLPSALSERERDYIILHEQTHIRRLDHIVRLVSFLALALHWFNPLVWAAFVLSGKDMEMSCDEAVMKKTGGDIRADYSASLLSLAAGRKIFAGAPLAFGEGDTKSRIKNVMNYKKPAFWIAAAALVISIALAVSLIADPRAGASEWQPQPAYENQDDYFEALAAARASDKTEEIAVEDTGDNEKTALAWTEAWLEMYKALPGDNMAYISDSAVDRLYMIKVSKEGLPKAFVFSVVFSVRPAYPLAQGGFWAAGNTAESPGRDETWGQTHIEVELRLEDDGKYHYVSSGTGAVGSLDIYDMVDNEGVTDETSGLPSYSTADIERIEFQNGNTGELVSYTGEAEINDIIEHLNAFRYDEIEPVASDGWTYAIRIWFKDESTMQRITLTPSSAAVGTERYISSGYDYFPQEWLEQYSKPAADNGTAENVVTEYLESEKKKDYVISLSVAEVKVSAEETARIKNMYSGSELAESYGWTDEYVKDNMIAVYARYDADYDNTKVPYNEGKLERYYYLTRTDSNAEWTIWDSTSPSDL